LSQRPRPRGLLPQLPGPFPNSPNAAYHFATRPLSASPLIAVRMNLYLLGHHGTNVTAVLFLRKVKRYAQLRCRCDFSRDILSMPSSHSRIFLQAKSQGLPLLLVITIISSSWDDGCDLRTTHSLLMQSVAFFLLAFASEAWQIYPIITLSAKN